MIFRKKKDRYYLLFFKLAFIVFFFFPFTTGAVAIGENINFSIDPVYDLKERNNIKAVFILETSKLYFYIDSEWWEGFSREIKNEIKDKLVLLGDEFEKNIYPILTSNYGSEWNPGIDNDSKITVLFHPLKKGAGGYFNSGNEYSRLEVPASNEREMVYINSDYLVSPLLKRLLAHEFTHLITFNQKERLNNIEEEVWLNEGRAEYAISLCGYDDVYQGSNLQKRVIEFLKNPSDSITDWQGNSSDYGALNLFIQYMIDHYSVKILNDSLHSNKKGIESINYALAKNGYKEDFSQIFTNWAIAVLVNDCSLGEKYCYKNSNLKNLKIIPNNFVFSGDVESVLKYNIYNWSAIWQKISSLADNISLEFLDFPNKDLTIFYLICENGNRCKINFLDNPKNKLFFSDFSGKYLVLIYILKSDSISNTFFSVKIESGDKNIVSEDEKIKNLLSRMEFLKQQIVETQAKIDAMVGEKKGEINKKSCKISNDLYFGIQNNEEVACLQQFLKEQGPEIYPEGLITGNFLSLTKKAIIRFQEKYFSEILEPLGLKKGTGFFGPATRAKVNSILNR